MADLTRKVQAEKEHFFVHSYGFMLEESHLQTLSENIPNVWSQFLTVIEKNNKTLFDAR